MKQKTGKSITVLLESIIGEGRFCALWCGCVAFIFTIFFVCENITLKALHFLLNSLLNRIGNFNLVERSVVLCRYLGTNVCMLLIEDSRGTRNLYIENILKVKEIKFFKEKVQKSFVPNLNSYSPA